MELASISQGICSKLRVAYRLVEDSCHAINEKLEILWTVQTTKEVTEEILGRWAIAGLGDGVQDEYQ